MKLNRLTLRLMLWTSVLNVTALHAGAFKLPSYGWKSIICGLNPARSIASRCTLDMTATIQQNDNDEAETAKDNPSSSIQERTRTTTDINRRKTLAGTAALVGASIFNEELGVRDFGKIVSSLGDGGSMDGALTPEVLKGDTIVRSLWLNRLAYPVLIVALEMGLFEALAKGPLSASELGARTNPALNGEGRVMEAILGVLSSSELLKMNSSEEVELTLAARQVLLKNSPFFWGPQLMAADGLTGSLRLAVRRDDKVPVKEYAASHSVSQVNSFIDSMQAHGSVTAIATARAIEPLLGPEAAHPATSILDMAGGSGCFAKALQHVCPHARVTVADIPSVVARFRSKHTTNPWWDSSNKIQAMPADLFIAETWPRGYDVHLLANVVHDWGKSQTLQILKASYQSLVRSNGQGRLILIEQLLNDDQAGPLAASLASVSMLLGDWRTGKQYSFRELKSLLTEAGFSSVELGPSCGNFHTAVIGYV